MKKRWFLLMPIVAAVLSLSLVSFACGDGDGGNGDQTPAATETSEATAADDTPEATDDGTPSDASAIDVSLLEFQVVPDPASAPAGAVTFSAENLGTEIHELVLFRTDLEPDALPTAADGSVDEAGAGIELIDEAEDIAAGDSAEVSADLEAGAYVLICNVVEEESGETVSHYQEGMHAAFTVE